MKNLENNAKSIVWVNGCFDVLHRGHIEMLKHAKSLGDFLVVGIDSDERIRSAKGATRPFNTLNDRKFILEALSCVDFVVSFSSDEELIQHVRSISPKFMVVGSDWKEKTVIGSTYVKQIVYFNRIGNYSTTKILGEIK